MLRIKLNTAPLPGGGVEYQVLSPNVPLRGVLNLTL